MTYSYNYNPLEFWTENGKSNIEYNTDKHKIQEQKLLEYLKTINSKFKFKSVLEIGCGYGRIADLIINNFNFNIDRYLGIDISNEQLDKAQLKFKKYQSLNRNILFLNIDITKFRPSDSVKADLVIAVDTLMHIKPENIHNVIESMVYLSHKHVINMDYYTDTDKQEDLEPHNFKHEYKDHYMRLGLDSVNNINTIPVKEIDQCIFHAIVK